MISAPMTARERVALLSLGAVLVVACLLSLGFGAADLGGGKVVRMLLEALGAGDAHATAADRAVLFSIRAPRVVLAAMVGATLGMAGAALQGLFRNPLADPALIGVSSGGSLGAALVIVVGGPLFVVAPEWVRPAVLPLAAFAGGLLATRLVLRLATLDGHTHVGVMLLAGVAVNAFVGAALGLISAFASDRELRDLLFWVLGSFGSASWMTIACVAPPMALSLLGLPRYARALDLMLLGDVEAKHLGVPVARVRVAIVAFSALGVGAAVSSVGLIGFVGLVVPHLVRLASGPRHRLLLPLSALLGAALLVVADTLARSVAAPLELPIGVLTALVGGPSFLALLYRERRRLA